MLERGTGRAPLMPTVKRACDACHRRKVKCEGSHPCKNCTQASLTCTFNAIPLNKGPKGSRAKVISELREKQHQPEVQWTLNLQKELPGSARGPSFTTTPDLVSREMVTGCIDFFFTHMYTTMPILSRERLVQDTDDMHRSPDVYCLVVSLCAFMSIQPGFKPAAEVPSLGPRGPGSNMTSGILLLEEVLRVRKSYDFVENPTVATVITSFFIFGCYFGLDKHNTAWFNLREATTLAQILGMHDETTYDLLDIAEASRRRRLFWLLFVTERAYALQRHRPLTLQTTIALPTFQEDPEDRTAVSGFLHLVHLFRPFDEVFISLWNKSSPVGTILESTTEPGSVSAPTRGWLAHLQHELAVALPRSTSDDLSIPSKARLNVTPTQAADLLTSQHWLRTMVWQLSTSAGFLSSWSPDPVLSFMYPMNITRDLLASTSAIDRSSMEVHGVGLVEKLFDIACTVTDVMSLAARAGGIGTLTGQGGWHRPIVQGCSSSHCLEKDGWEISARDSLSLLYGRIASLRGGNTRFLPLLQKKISDTLPEMGWPLQNPRPLTDEQHLPGSQTQQGQQDTEDVIEIPQPFCPGAGIDDNGIITTADKAATIKQERLVSSPMLSPEGVEVQQLQTPFPSQPSTPTWVWPGAAPPMSVPSLVHSFDSGIPSVPRNGKEDWLPG